MNSDQRTDTNGRGYRQAVRANLVVRSVFLALLGVCLVGAVTLSGAGGAGGARGAATALATPTRVATPVASAATVEVTVSSPTHKPKVNVPWPVKVTVTNAQGKALAATLTMEVLFSGQPVGKIDKGAVYHFVGTWQEHKGNDITWPAAARGEPLTLQFIVKAQGVTVRKNWAITVR